VQLVRTVLLKLLHYFRLDCLGWSVGLRLLARPRTPKECDYTQGNHRRIAVVCVGMFAKVPRSLHPFQGHQSEAMIKPSPDDRKTGKMYSEKGDGTPTTALCVDLTARDRQPPYQMKVHFSGRKACTFTTLGKTRIRKNISLTANCGLDM
jgi:hypothetical protein